MHTIKNGPWINISTHKGITLRNIMDSRQINREANNEQMISDKRVLVNIDSDEKTMESDGCIRTRYGRIIRKPDRLAY